MRTHAKINLRLLSLAALCLMATTQHAAAKESETRHISIGKQERSYLLYRPESATRQAPAPLVIVLHGGLGSGEQAERSYGWDEMADEHGFVVAYPDGIGRTWNAGGACCGKAMKEKADDPGFITALIEKVSRDENIDPKRVYLTGISNGAALSYRYACEGDYPIAAIGTVSGSMSFACPRSRALSVMEIHGMDDRNIPFGGGVGTRGLSKIHWQPVQKTLDAFRDAAKCRKASTYMDGMVTTSVSPCPGGREVTLVTIEGAGHQWPGSRPHGMAAEILLHPDPPSDAMNATGTLWNFFRRHSSD